MMETAMRHAEHDLRMRGLRSLTISFIIDDVLVLLFKQEQDGMTLEQRVTVIEKELRDLKRIVSGKKVEKDWRKTFGMSASDPGFDEMIRLGREIREQDREDDIATTIISAEEQFRGWLAQIRRKRDPHQQATAYKRLQQRIDFFAAWNVLPWDTASADILQDLRKQRVRIGTMDLKYVSVVLSRDAMLLIGSRRPQAGPGRVIGPPR